MSKKKKGKKMTFLYYDPLKNTYIIKKSSRKIYTKMLAVVIQSDEN